MKCGNCGGDMQNPEYGPKTTWECSVCKSMLLCETLVKTCEGCRFWVLLDGSKGLQGECRRRAPTVFRVSSGETPKTWKDYWCGEWEPKPNQT